MATVQPAENSLAPRVPADSRVYAVGDIHGRADLLRILHRKIAADDDAADPVARRVVVYVGDYVDRGAESADVIEMLVDQPLAGFSAVHLKGNHEDFLLTFLDDADVGEVWVMNGAVATLLSYGVEVFDHDPGTDIFAAARRDLAANLPAHHLRFLQGLLPYHVEGDYAFVHAGVRPGVRLEDQVASDLLWIREDFLASDADFGHCVVHGHTVETQPCVRPNRIGIDTGAFFTNRLTGLVLEGDRRRFIHT